MFTTVLMLSPNEMILVFFLLVDWSFDFGNLRMFWNILISTVYLIYVLNVATYYNEHDFINIMKMIHIHLIILILPCFPLRNSYIILWHWFYCNIALFYVVDENNFASKFQDEFSTVSLSYMLI